jgi:hypothetical protein
LLRRDRSGCCTSTDLDSRALLRWGGQGCRIPQDEEAFRRSAELDANRVTVETEGGTVTLRGTVRSWAERQETERVAWATPGVVRVNNLITTAPEISLLRTAVVTHPCQVNNSKNEMIEKRQLCSLAHPIDGRQ